MTTPAISIVLPVCNGARYLRQALASMRWQTFSDWECVCVNDGSTDGTGEILRDFVAADRRFQIIDQENQGLAGALNAGVRAARADWIARMDGDDVALPHRLAVQYKFVADNPQYLLVGSDMQCIDPEGRPIGFARYAAEHGEIERRLLTAAGGEIAHPTVLMRRQAVVDVGFYRDRYEFEDTDLWVRLARHGRLGNVPEALLQYRLHEASHCWKRRGSEGQQMHALLTEAYHERGATMPPQVEQRLTEPRRQRYSTAAGKWARRAARAGYYRAAATHWLRQVRAEPLSPHTARVTLEAALRGMGSLLRAKRPPVVDLPDWRPWDCPGAAPRDLAA